MISESNLQVPSFCPLMKPRLLAMPSASRLLRSAASLARNRQRLSPCGLRLAAVFLLITSFVASATDAASPQVRNLTYGSAWINKTVASNGAIPAFNSWAYNFLKSSGQASSPALSEGLALAKQPRALLLDLIKSNPAQALALAVPAPLRDRLPAEVVAELETRVSGISDLSVVSYTPALGGPHVEGLIYTVALNGRTYKAFVYGRRAAQGSKQGIPIHGIVLDGNLAVHESAL